jgi:hypothetical protein
MNNHNKLYQMMKYFLNLLLAGLISGNLFSQEKPIFKAGELTIGLGLALNDGLKETGNGLTQSIGWSKALDKKRKLRIHPSIIFGQFAPLLVTDTRDMYYNITNYNLRLDYDLIRYKAVSLVASGGVFMQFSRGLIGTGGESNYKDSEYFARLYFGGNLSGAIRVNPAKSRITYEYRPINISFGNNDFILAIGSIGISFKFKDN